MVKDTVIVKAWGKTIAKIVENNRGTYDFSMNPKNALPFSDIKMKTMGITYNFSHIVHQYGLPGLINDSLPGQYGHQVLDEFFMKHSGRLPTPLEKLQILGDNTLGALIYEPEILTGKKGNKSAILDIAELYEETRKVLYGEQDFELEQIIAISNSAAGGAQPKAVVGIDPIRGKMYVGKKSEPLPSGFIHGIVKFDNLIYTRNGAKPTFYENNNVSKTTTEYIYSILAKKSGINMPNTHLIEDGMGGHHFCVERFDIKKKDDAVERIHMHSLSGLMHHHPGETTLSYERLFNVGVKLNIPHEDIEMLFRTMIFNIVFANRDDHTKNFSYLMENNGIWRSAPAYDLTFAPSKKHQMLFGVKDVNNIQREDLLSIANTYHIRDAGATIDQIIDVKYSYLSELSAQYNIKPIWVDQIFNITSDIDKKIGGERTFVITDPEGTKTDNDINAQIELIAEAAQEGASLEDAVCSLKSSENQQDLKIT